MSSPAQSRCGSAPSPTLSVRGLRGRRAPCTLQPKLAHAEYRQRQRERHDVIEQPEQQQSRQQFLVELPERDQHGGVEHAEPAGRMAGKAEQRRGNEDHRDVTKSICGSSGTSMYIASAQKPRSTMPMHDLQQRERSARQAAPSSSPRPITRGALHTQIDVGHEHREHRDAEDAVEPRRQLVDRTAASG